MRRFEIVPMQYHPDQYEVVEVGAPVNPRTGRRNAVEYAKDAIEAVRVLTDWQHRARSAPCLAAWTPLYLTATPDGKVRLNRLGQEPETACVQMGGPVNWVFMRQDAVADFLAYWGTVEGLILPGLLCDRCGEPTRPGTFCKGNDECIAGPGGSPAECCDGWGPYCCRCGADYAIDQM